MAIHVGIEHSTRYRYDRPVAHGPHVIRLRPAPHTRTPIRDYELRIGAKEHRVYWQEDPFGNLVARVVFEEPIRELDVEVRLTAEMTVVNPFDFFVESYAETYPFRYDPLLAAELAPYFAKEPVGGRMGAWLAGLTWSGGRAIDFLIAVNQRVQRDVGYTIRMAPGVQTPDETLTSAMGSCRDSAWLLVQALRQCGLAARFASGYLIQLTADEKSLDGPSGPEVDFTDLHAWTEVYLPGAGWIGLDPTSGLFAGEGHIPLACTPEPASAAPVVGAIDECEVTFEHRNVVRRIHEDPRVTRPYSDEAWESIDVLGKQVDADLAALDVRLTMGGEPTFVSIDDMDSAQWNTEALGHDKRARAGVLLRRLGARVGTGALLHFGQGKWYPGEPLPRWALGCHWREDGRPLWRDPALVATDGRDYGVRGDVALHFARSLATRLGVKADYVAPGYEDWIYHVWREASRPPNLDPVTIPWAPQFRDDCSQALARGLGEPVGGVLPLAWDWAANAWHSAPWSFARGDLYLVPGSSPMGLRLPMGLVPVAVLLPDDEPMPPVSPRRLAGGEGETTPVASLVAADERPDVIRRRASGWTGVPFTAVCVEARAGILHVFLPPLQELDRYAALVTAVEATAAALAVPVLVEGYEPPRHPALRTVRVTPDPGVIEVNVHPAGSWETLTRETTTLYAEAREARLGTEKFMLDGRHTGTGGGNHVTLGGATPGDSPFLRRPDLIRSLVTYWQHHPSLSYLFSGLFIGPTSQAPRVDECATAELIELERSLAEIERASTPAVIDRALRTFLADVSGNTHRAEFSIDKLWSPDGPAGRQGLLEFRGFEMPPHARMSLAQMLLVRALVARFWKAPYQAPLVPWGTALHDRFMLPHFVWRDVGEVVDDLAGAGYPFRREWYLPFLEFRFPVYGRVRVEGVDLELRMALEPWLVLDDEGAEGRQARVVDSSVERVQVRCVGLDPARHVLACNGRRVPLHPTGDGTEAVAGVRYKAWPAPLGRHPTVPVHAPLVFDLFDRRLGHSLGGCTYHVAHPGGRADDALPVNANAAESRRVARFWPWGCTTALAEPAPAPANPDAPLTLDLRRLDA